MGLLFKNNAETTLSSGINNSVTTVPVTSAAVFPTPDANNVFFATIDDGSNIEVVKVTGISSNDLTVVRAQDNTSAATFGSGAKIELRLTAQVLDMGTASLTDLDGDTKVMVEESSDEDKIRFDTGGSERMIIDDSGNVGIGMTPFTGSTGYVLQLNGTSQSFLSIHNNTTGNTVSDGFSLGNDASNVYLTNRENTPMIFSTNDTERMRIDASGNVGVGTSSPGEKFAVKGDASYIEITHPTASSYSGIKFSEGGTPQGSIQNIGSTFATTERRGNLEIFHNTGGNVTLQHNSGGKVGIGTSDPDTDGYSYAEDLVIKAGGSASDGAGISINSASRTYGVIAFGDSAATNAGEIFYTHTSNALYIKTNAVNRFSLDSSGNGVFSGNVTAYGTPSDIKLKEDIEVIDNALDKVKQLKGITYTLKSDGNRLTGLIAQDLEKVLPEAVYTSKTIADEREGEVSEEHLAIRYGNTVGLLVEAIKEQQEQIEALTAKVKELEDK